MSTTTTLRDLVSRVVDERFRHHRERATAWGGRAGACVAGGLFLWRHHVDGTWRWDLLAVLAAIALVKLAVMAWQLVKD